MIEIDITSAINIVSHNYSGMTLLRDRQVHIMKASLENQAQAKYK